MWIMIIKKVPVEVSPPIMSIFWSGSSAENLSAMIEQKRKAEKHPDFSHHIYDGGNTIFDEFGHRPKEDGSRWIIFDNAPIKIWPHEYTQVSDLTPYLFGTGNSDYTMSHLPCFGRLKLIDDFGSVNLDYRNFSKEVFEAALVDGADDVYAFYVACGVYFEKARPPIDMWFCLNKTYASYINVSDWELEWTFKKLPMDVDMVTTWVE